MTTLNETEPSEILSRLNNKEVLVILPSTILATITMLVGFIGNLLTCYVYGFRLKMTPTYLFVVMLAVVDLITCAIITPARIFQNVFPMMTTSDVLCKLHMTLLVFTGYCTCGFLLAISVDRYRRMCYPLKSQLTMRCAKITTLVIYLISTAQGSAAILYYGSVRKPTKYPNVFTHCCSATVHHYQVGFFASYLLLAITTVILMIGLYSVLLHTMKKIVNDVKTVSNPSETESQRENLKVDLTTTSTGSIRVTRSGSIKTLDKEVTSIPRPSISGVSAVIVDGDSENPFAFNAFRKRDSSIKRAEDNRKRLNRTTVTMMLITAVFIAASIPSVSGIIVETILESEQKMGTAAAIFYWLARHTFYISSCLNPVIYGFRNEDFKEEVRQLFCKFK